MSTEHDSGGSRALVVEQTVDAPPDVVWRTLTDPQELKRWFPLDARVEPGVGGRVWISWGPGVEGEAPIHVWNPPERFGWTESHGADEQGRPVKLAVDFHVEGRGGVTVVRLVQSGFGPSSDWDATYDALRDGWTYFLFNLAFYLARHRGEPRHLVWRRAATDLARDAVWKELLGGALVGVDGAARPGGGFELRLAAPTRGEVVSARTGHVFVGTLPELDDGLLFIEIEASHVGVWLSLYGAQEERARELQTALNARLDKALGAP